MRLGTTRHFERPEFFQKSSKQEEENSEMGMAKSHSADGTQETTASSRISLLQRSGG